MNKDEKMKLPRLTSLDDLLSTQEEREEKKLEKVQMISIKEIYDFPNHPYMVKDDEEMEDMVNSIKEMGVLHPVILRPKQNGYEMISGHRRKRASELAGKTEIRAIVKEMTDEEAIIAMVDSNKQRERVLPSEKAFAYKMKLEAMKKQGKRNDLTLSPTATKLNEKGTAEIIGKEFGEGRDNVYRYIRLTELTKKFLDLVDEGKIAIRPAVEISYLNEEEQEYLLETIEYTEVFPSHPQTREMKKLSQEGNLTEDEIDRIMSKEKPNQKEQVKVPDEELQQYYPKDVISAEQKRKYIVYCVRKISELEEKQKQRKMEYTR